MSGPVSIFGISPGPIAGAVAGVVLGFALRGSGGGKAGSTAAQGVLDTEIADPGKA